MKCTTCGQEIVLRPSAAERAQRYGGKPSDYTKMFTQHMWCTTLEIVPPQLNGNYQQRDVRDWFLRSASCYDPATHPHGFYLGKENETA